MTFLGIDQKDWPAWIQAIFSIVAIVVAGRTVVLTARQSRLEKLNGVDAIFLLASQSLLAAQKALEQHGQNGSSLSAYNQQPLEEAKKLFDNVLAELIDIGSEKLPGMTLDARARVTQSIEAVNSAKIAVTNGGSIDAEKKIVRENCAAVTTHRSEVRKFARRQKRKRDLALLPFISD